MQELCLGPFLIFSLKRGLLNKQCPSQDLGSGAKSYTGTLSGSLLNLSLKWDIFNKQHSFQDWVPELKVMQKLCLDICYNLSKVNVK